MSSSSSGAKNSIKRIEKLFLKFAAFFGHVWRSQFRDPKFLEFAKQEWHVALERFDDQVISQAIESYREGVEYPPVLPQFIAKCRQLGQRFETLTRQETRKVSSTDVAKGHIKKIKAILGGKPC